MRGRRLCSRFAVVEADGDAVDGAVWAGDDWRPPASDRRASRRNTIDRIRIDARPIAARERTCD